MLSTPWQPLAEVAELAQHEKAWPQMHPFLHAMGYELRPRYQPCWVPSWRDGTWPKSGYPEDSMTTRTKYFVDAVESGTGERVGLKLVKLDNDIGGQELEIHQYLQKGSVRDDPRNPCIQLLEILHPPSHPNERLLVMPLLYSILSISFKRVSERVDFVGQILRGMAFLHEHNIAHRDICPHNLVMEAPGYYPEGCHPVDNTRSEDGSSFSHRKSLREVKPKYYFIDFGLSIKYGSPNERKETSVIRGMYRNVPEYERPGPWDGFKIDVYCMGFLIYEEVVKGHINMNFLRPLVKKMTRDDPLKRPTAREAVNEFEKSISSSGFTRTLSNVFKIL
ncbi:kinase-like protein [Rickenella mellea]|uniref:Kinase-like protein n=1 Tax=Rickenella mellea TaxID=50990 RepID=A0A4Y7Q5J0_9AGAM|nr:kinase-like protein [Rickenella mellea]